MIALPTFDRTIYIAHPFTLLLAYLAGTVVLIAGAIVGLKRKRKYSNAVLILLAVSCAFSLSATAFGQTVYRRYLRHGGYVDVHYDQCGRERYFQGAPSHEPHEDRDSTIPEAPKPADDDEKESLVPTPARLDRLVDLLSEEEQENYRNRHPVGPTKPPWHFTRTVRLSSFRGGYKLPYDGFRGCVPFVCASLHHAAGRQLDEQTIKEVTDLDPERDGTPSNILLRYLKQNYSVRQLHQPTPNDLVRHLDAGLPVYVLIRADKALHACLVTGYQTGRNGEVLSWTLTDNGVVHGEVPHDKFLDMWNTRPNRYALLISRDEGRVRHVFEKTVSLPHVSVPENTVAVCNGAVLLAGILQGSGVDVHTHNLAQIGRQVDSDEDGLFPRECATYLGQFFDVRDQTDTTIDELMAQLDAGLPPLVTLSKEATTFFWSLVVGYRTDQRGNHESWTLIDQHGKFELSHDEFLATWDRNVYPKYSLFFSPNDAKPKPTFPSPQDFSTVVTLPHKEFTYIRERDTSAETAVPAFLLALGQPLSHEQVFNLIRHVDPEKDGTTQKELVEFLQQCCEIEQRVLSQSFQLWREFRCELDSGRPIIISLRDELDLRAQNWAVLIGYRTDSDGEIRSWAVMENGMRHGKIPHLRFSAHLTEERPFMFLKPGTKTAALAAIDARLVPQLSTAMPKDGNESEFHVTSTEPVLSTSTDVPEQVNPKAATYFFGFCFLLLFAVVLANLTKPRFATT